MKLRLGLVSLIGLLVVVGVFYVTYQNPFELKDDGNIVKDTQLGFGESKSIQGVTITPLELIEDSRCPINAECVSRGRVIVQINISDGLTRFTENIELGQSLSVTANGDTSVKFISVTPELVSTKSISLDDYRFEFNVIKKPQASENPPLGACYVGGCSSQVCSDEEGLVSTCEFRSEYACYRTAQCKRQTNGQCGWTETLELKACLSNPPALE